MTNNQNAGGDAAAFVWRILRGIGRFTLRWAKRLAIFVALFYITAQVIFFALNLYDRTLGAPIFSGTPIPYKQLATEASHPYKSGLMFGPTGTQETLAYKLEWDSALARFNNVKSCLVTEEQFAKNPDLRMLDWQKLRTLIDVDVCMFRIFASIGNIKQSLIWLKDLQIASRKLRVGGSSSDALVIDEEIAARDIEKKHNKKNLSISFNWDNYYYQPGFEGSGTHYGSFGYRHLPWSCRRAHIALTGYGILTQIHFDKNDGVHRLESIYLSPTRPASPLLPPSPLINASCLELIYEISAQIASMFYMLLRIIFLSVITG